MARDSLQGTRKCWAAQSLNLPRTAGSRRVAHARAWSGGGAVSLRLPPGSPPDLAALAGKEGLICVMLVDYLGFEPVQRLVAAASPLVPRRSAATILL